MDAGRRAGGKTHAGTRGRRVAIVGPCSLKRNDKEGSFGRKEGEEEEGHEGRRNRPSLPADGAAASNVAAAAAATITMPYDARFFEEEEEKRGKEGGKDTHACECVCYVRARV